MSGIDKIYLTDRNEYSYFKSFLERHELEFFKKHRYSLVCCLWDIEPCYFTGNEVPVSNFSTETDVFIIQHLSESDFTQMPNVVNRLKEQYSDFDLILHHNSVYDRYQIDRSGCRLKLVESSNNKTFRHIKRERWEQVDIQVYSNCKNIKDWWKYSLDFDYFSKTIFQTSLGCKYIKYIGDDDGNYYQFLNNVSIRQVCRYISQVRLKRGFTIVVHCHNYQRSEEGVIEDIINFAEYTFEVV